MFKTTALTLAFLAATTQAFVPGTRPSTPTFCMSSNTHISKDFTADSGMNEAAIPVLIDNLNQENFLESLEMLEPLMTNECVGEVCDLYMGDLEEKCEKVGMDLPKDFPRTHH